MILRSLYECVRVYLLRGNVFVSGGVLEPSFWKQAKRLYGCVDIHNDWLFILRDFNRAHSMSLLDQAKHIPHGVSVISKWLGSGGEVVDQQTAQARANVCLGKNPYKSPCPNNLSGFKPTTAVAAAVKQYLSVKNGLGLQVAGEAGLGTCSACGCVLKLIVWQPQDKIHREITDEERPRLPSWCWKLRNE